MGIREIFYRLWEEITFKLVYGRVIATWGNLNLCTGLQAGKERAVHVVLAAQDSVMTPDKALEHPGGGQMPENADKNRAHLVTVLESLELNTSAKANMECPPRSKVGRSS